MFRKILRKNAKHIRFFSALVLCVMFIAASPTSPSDDEGCGSMSSGDDYVGDGYIRVVNAGSITVNVELSGPFSTSFNLTPGQPYEFSAPPGSYSVVAKVNHYGSPWNGQVWWSRSFNLSGGETEYCTIVDPF